MLKKHPLSVAILLALSPLALAAEPEQIVVTGVRMDEPLHLTTNPKMPRQPLPAHDGADYLKTIPGFSVIRKGGADGDPVLRGMAGSRLSMMMDGELILGGCTNRMDPPTAYIFPEAFDSIRVIKGPQSVQYGPGNSAGVVLFERDDSRPTEAAWNVHSSLVAGSFGRHDEVLDASYSNPDYSIRGTVTESGQDNYEDGDGTEIHSNYQRWNAQLSLAWTPSADTRIELALASSDGEAAYADRGVDGSKFARDNYSLKFKKQNLTETIESLEFNAYYNYVDHVMDNYSLRTLSGMMATPMAMNPDRETTGARLALSLKPALETRFVLGLDTQSNQHSNRNTMNQTMMPFEAMARTPDAEFSQFGVFAEAEWDFSAVSRLVSGWRTDRWQVEDQRTNVAVSMMMSLPNPTAGQEREDTLHSGFARLETAPGDGSLVYFAGLGHSERFPDYWEMIAKETETSLSAFNIDAEKTTQLDAGVMVRKEHWEGSASFFVSRIDDFLMVESNYSKAVMGGMMGGTRNASIVRNIEARTWGFELDGQYHFNDNWRSELTLASVRGANESDNRTLPQLPPLEARLGLYFDHNDWSAGVLWRGIAAQDRFDLNRGNIVGQDLGPTGSANVFSLNAGWRFSDYLMFSGGIDNLFDETYAEHISRAGASIPGFDQLTRVNEPGRIFWARAQFTF